MSKRDLQIINVLLRDEEPETKKKVDGYLSKLDKGELEGLIGIKKYLAKNRIRIKRKGAEGAFDEKKVCQDIVCNFVACAVNSDCNGSACSANACSAAAGCYVSSLAGCGGTPTCGSAACSSNAGGNCGSSVCSYGAS